MNANYVLFYTIYYPGGFRTRYEFFENLDDLNKFIFNKIKINKEIEYRIFKGV